MSVDRLPLAAVLGLGVTQIIGYGTLYYAFRILAPAVAEALKPNTIASNSRKMT